LNSAFILFNYSQINTVLVADTNSKKKFGSLRLVFDILRVNSLGFFWLNGVYRIDISYWHEQASASQQIWLAWLDVTKNFHWHDLTQLDLVWVFAGLTSFKRSNWRGFFKLNALSERMFSKTLHTIRKISIVSQSQLVETESLCLLQVKPPKSSLACRGLAWD
jgi:hypothetical protein